MPVTHSHLARKFADGISEKFASRQFREALRNAVSQYEHKATAPLISQYLDEHLKAESAGSSPPTAVFTWEGNKKKGSPYGYPILGTWTFPDAAVLSPFRCAFEFDREAKLGGAGFKAALMKASVHVLSGAYEACVLVYILQPRSTPHKYLNDGSDYTRRLIEALRANGLFLALTSASA